MKALDIRDIIGPIMIGPSSSHTAGALRIALMTRHMLPAQPVRVTFRLYGSFAHTYKGHGTDRALVAGILGFAADDERIPNSMAFAREQGLEFSFIPDQTTVVSHPNTVDITVVDSEGGTTEVRGESIGGGAAQIVRLNGIDVLLTGEYYSLVVRQHDVRGVLSHIARCMADFDINIATARLFREARGEIAYTIMESDDRIPPEIIRAIEANRNIYEARIIKSDRSENPEPPEQADDAAARGIIPTGFGAELTEVEALELFTQVDFKSGADLLTYCEAEGTSIGEAICRRERCLLASRGIAIDDTHHYLRRVLEVMSASIHGPISSPKASMGGLIGGEAAKLEAFGKSSKSVVGSVMADACTYAIAVLETNASMGRIVAAPTAGSSGVIPAVLFALQATHGFSDEELNSALANAAAIGLLITRNATVSGAEGGCQAEIGAASAMAASAAVQLFGGTPKQCLDAAATAIAGLLGLVCDPIAGLVETPCQKRNATGASNALVAAQITLAGCESLVDFDETVAAMYTVGKSLPMELRETALGGMAATPTACTLCSSICG